MYCFYIIVYTIVCFVETLLLTNIKPEKTFMIFCRTQPDLGFDYFFCLSLTDVAFFVRNDDC